MKIFATLLVSASLLSAANFSRQMNTFARTLITDSLISKNSTAAVLPFESSEKIESGDLGTAAAEFLISEIIAEKKITLVDRTRLNVLMQEQSLSASGMVDDTKLIEMGKLLSADYIITGKITKAMNTYLVTAQIIDTRTSEIRGAAKISLPVQEINQAVEKLYGREKVTSGAVFRSLLIPGWGQSFAEKPVPAVIFGSLCGIGLAGSVATGVIQKNSFSSYKSYKELSGTSYAQEQKRVIDSLRVSAAEADGVIDKISADKYDQYEQKNAVFSAAVIGTSAIWAANVVNAFILGRKAEKQSTLYFSINPISETLYTGIAFSF